MCPTCLKAWSGTIKTIGINGSRPTRSIYACSWIYCAPAISSICASERQRDYWLGWLHAQKRINPHTYRQDPTLRKLIDVIPFGLPAEPLVATQRVLKGVHPGIGEGDYLLLWSGGLWDWLDPLTLIRSVGQLAPRYPALKLYFMGTHHPNPLVTGMSMPEKAVQLSQELGLYREIRLLWGLDAL